MDVSDFKIGKGITIRNGSDVTIIATGNILYNAKCITDKLINEELDVRLISMHTVKPLDRSSILESAQETKVIFTIEEHSLIGGLGSAVAEVLAETDSKKVLFRRFALPDRYLKDIGSQEYLRRKNALSIDQITNSILEQYNSIKESK